MVTPSSVLEVERLHWYLATLLTALFSVFNIALLLPAKGRVPDDARRMYTAYVIAIAAWSSNVFLFSYTTNRALSQISCVILHTAAIFIPIFLLDFTQKFFKFSSRWDRIERICAYGSGVIFTALMIARPTWFISGLVPKRAYPFFLNPGPLYAVWVLSFFYLVISSHTKMLFAYLNSKGDKKKRIAYFIFPSMIAYLGCMGYFLPVYDIFVFPYPIGCFGSIALPFIFGYGILKHRMLGIDIFIKKTIVFAGVFVFVYGVFALFLALGQQYFVDLLGLPIWTAMVPTILVITLTLRPLEAWLINVTDRYLFQKKIDWKDFIHQFNREVLTQYDLDKIIESTHRVVETTIRPERFAIYLVDPREDAYTSRSEQFTEAFGASSKLVEHLSGKRKYLLAQGDARRGEASEAAMELARTGAVLAVPMIHGEAMIGFMLFGSKKSDEPYSKDDIEILSDLVIAETNAIVIAKQTGERVSARAAEYLGQLADGLSHQYNNILSAVIRQLEMVSVKLEMESAKAGGSATLDDLNARVKEAVQDADRGTQFAKSVLNHTRPGRVGFDVQDLSSAVEVGVKLVYMKHRDFKTLKLTTDIAKDLPKTWCNITSMQNIFQITVDNAYDAIKMRQEQEPGLEGRIRVAIRHKKLENVIRIEIEDNGVGMKPHILRSVQAQVPHVTTKGSASEKSGFGAGVNFLGKLVAMHQGKLEYNSEHMNGTVAVIELPVLDRPAEASTARTDQPKER